MDLRRDSKIVRWAYLDTAPPRQTSLCSLFWRIVLVSPAACALLVVLSPVWGPIALWCKYAQPAIDDWEGLRYQHKIEREARRKSGVPLPVQPPWWAVIAAGFKAVKGKVCPIVTIIGD